MPSINCILGVDPGLSGAIAFYFPSEPSTVSVFDMPVADGAVSAPEVARILEQFRPDCAIIEMVGARPGQGVSSMFKFGRAFGTVIGVVGALKVPTHYAASTKWKRYYSLTSDKEESRAKALHLWPKCSESFSKKKHDGRAEAALLARYGAEAVFKNPAAEVVGRGVAGRGGDSVAVPVSE